MIFFIERNIRGGWAVYGSEGVKQYYGYTKEQAERMYRDSERDIVCKKPKTGSIENNEEEKNEGWSKPSLHGQASICGF